jgi:hypothetical protein
MRPNIKCLSLDTGIRHFTSVLVGRQASRASVIGAMSSLIFAPILAPFVIISEVDAPPPVFFTFIFALLTSLFGLTVAVFAYKFLYRGSRRALGFAKWAARIGTPFAWLFLLLPIVLMWHVASDPLIAVYAIALAANIAVQIWFLRWTKSYATAWGQAYRESTVDYQFFSPGGGRTFSFMLREIFAAPPGWLIDKRKMAKIVALMSLALLLEGWSFSVILQANQAANSAMRFDLPKIGILTDRYYSSTSG